MPNILAFSVYFMGYILWDIFYGIAETHFNKTILFITRLARRGYTIGQHKLHIKLELMKNSVKAIGKIDSSVNDFQLIQCFRNLK